MALKNPNLYPQFCVYVWKETQNDDGEWEAYVSCQDKFDNEPDAFALYKSISIGDGIVEVDLEKHTEYDTIPLRHKDTMNGFSEYIY